MECVQHQDHLTLMDETYKLSIIVTNECNMRCEFCIEDTHTRKKLRKEDDSVYVDDLIRLFENNKIKYDYVFLTGGEPFHRPERLFKTIDIVKHFLPETKLSINTNGTYMTLQDAHWFNEYHPDIFINISIDGLDYGYRSLNDLLNNHYTNGYETVAAIKTLKNKRINAVVTWDQVGNYNIPYELFALHKMFDTNVIINLDESIGALNKITIDDIMNVQVMMNRIYHLVDLESVVAGDHGTEKKKSIMVNKFAAHTSYCSGPKLHMWSFNAEGHFVYQPHFVCQYDEKGCGQQRDSMKPGLYDLISKVCSSADPSIIIPGQPYREWNYDMSRGYVPPKKTPANVKPQDVIQYIKVE